MRWPSRRLVRAAGRLAIVTLPVLGWTLTAADGTAGDNALENLNRFIAERAATTPAYRTDLQRNADFPHVPDGRLSGFSPLIGPFTYRPKTYAELTLAERAEILRDGRFRAYLLANGRPFQVTPEDMLQSQPLVVQLGPP